MGPTLIYVVNKPWAQGTIPQYHPDKKLYFWTIWTSRLGNLLWEGQERSPPAGCTVVKHLQSCWGCSYRPANLAAEAARCLFGCNGSSFPLPSTISLPGTCICLGWIPQCLSGCVQKLCKAWLNTTTSVPCTSCVQDEPKQILTHLLAAGVVTTLQHMERGQLPDQLSFPCLIS